MGDETRGKGDERVNFIEDYVMRVLQIKKDKWTKMITTDELRDVICDFFDDPKIEKLMFYINAGGSLTPCSEFPLKLKTKLTYIIRSTVPFFIRNSDDMLNECIMGDLLPNTMANFSALIDNVFIPILQSPENQDGWTQIMAKDMRSECQSLRNYIAQMQGHMINKTILNLPICIDEVMAISPKIAAGDTSVLSTRNKDSLEGIVVKWFDSVVELIQIKAADKVFEHEKNPLPSRLFSYWQTRLENLEDLTQQLGTAQIKTIGYVLESIDSVFVRQFKNMVHDILKALVEARDVIANLTPLKKFLDRFEATSLEDNRKNIRPLLLIVTLVWSNSKYFSTTENMSLLFILVNNSLLDTASRLLEPDAIFQGEIDEAYNKTNLVIDICNHYRQTYEDIRQNLGQYKSPMNKQAQDWTWKPKTIFGYMDEYIERVHELQGMFETGIDFMKLEKVNFGAFRGRQISTAVDKIYEEFNLTYHEWDNIQFNPMELDPSDKSFRRAANKYKAKIDILERKLAFQFERALEDTHELSLSIYLVELLGTLLHRPIIKQQTYGYLVNIIHTFADELDTIKLLYDENIAIFKSKGIKGLPVDKNLAQVSGILMWIAQVRQRIEWPYKEFPLMEFPDLFKNELGEDVLKRYHEMMNYLNNFQALILKMWKNQCMKDISSGMKKPLLRMENDQLYVNFDNEVNKNRFSQMDPAFIESLLSLCLKIALKDIKNIKLMDIRVPSKIASFFDKETELWVALLKLMRIAEWYNDIYERTEPCEINLIIGEMENILQMLTPSFSTITYNNYDQAYIDDCYNTIHNVHRRLLRTQLNLELIRKNIKAWGDIPLYERKNNDDKELLYVDDRIGTMERRYMKCIETKNLINVFVNLNFKLFFNLPEVTDWLANIGEEDESTRPLESVTAATTVLVTQEQRKDLEHQQSSLGLDNYKEIDLHDTEELLATLSDPDQVKFRAYLEYCDNVIGEELVSAITTSIKYVKSEMEKPNTPLFEITMELDKNDVKFILNIDMNDFYGFYNHVEEITEDIYRMASMMTKINDPENTYSDILTEALFCYKMKVDIFHKVKYVLNAVKSHYINEYEDKSYIWKDDKTKYLFEFKKYGHALDEIERENLDGPNAPVPLKEDNPPLPLYKEQMDRFIALYDVIASTWKDTHEFSGWLRLNKKLFKSNVLREVNNWFNLFRDDLVTRVQGGLQELDDFITEAMEILKIDLDKDDFEGLLKIMGILNKINEKQLYYDSMFEPFRDIVELLKSYNYQFEPKVFQQFNELPDQWLKVKKLASVAKQMILPIQAYQVDLIEKRVILYDNYTSTFRRKFLLKPFFHVPCQNVYDEFDATHLELFALESQYQHLKDSAALFELPIPDRTKIDRCRSELQLLKQLWDFVIGIDSTIEDWKKTPWKKIDIENMDSECKKFGKDLRTLKPECRVWDPYLYCEAILKNLMTSLRAVTELQNPAIRERHWSELMKQTGLKIDLGDSTTLANLLDLNLQNYEEEVKNIVDKSVKEQAMEKFLRELQATWSSTSFGTESHERTGLQLLQVSEEIIETLEDHQVQLQNLLGSKYIAYFYDEVSNWQIKLANADQVISSWLEVQRKWQYLESIFIGSEDIRSQLPEDSKRFDGIDTEFKGLLGQMVNELNVVKATNRSGLYEKLENLERQLILCEKALNDYLETKRLSYPRFYFVSSADLLDILSNGNNPIAVCKHLTKLYDSLGKLQMLPNSKNASGMVAKELEEYVPFIVKCDCAGKVEVWLNRVTDAMRDTLRDHLRRAVVAYEEKPRHVWIFEWPAQPTLVTTQIWWTAETNDSFAKLDLGYENALKDFNKKQINQLNALIILLLGDLTPGERQTIMTVCTIDVHSRDVIAKMIIAKIELASAFQWQSQLRHRWDLQIDDCFANICDAQFRYDYEYLGNTPRLVITPLTDRCYITLTQSLHLVMGGAPAGPAGTGKTETTKDLGKAIGMMVYVFNCSEQMDYKSCGNIHKGLAQTGAWGCFDEFNRISVEVLSVIAVQVKSIQDAIKTKKIMFNFSGEIIKLRPTVGLFITMNPGYAGRAELPENLKALYRPCAMVVPDFALICEIMLVAEGFQEARLLARKFITLYTLCKELLSKQDHYDWGLRAIKSVLVVAGSLRRGDRNRPEDQVLMRALRDFNIPKIVTDDVPVFMGLIGDLFPALNVPRKRLLEFEATIKQSTIDLKLQPEEGFILKVVQLEELFAVRHSVFIIGFAGTGKSEVWKALNKTYANQKRKPFFNDLNPKAVTNDELFGIVNPATREWKDGLFSIIMRDQANMSGNGPKWIVLDGDIDPMWIESLNTVMDDNKVLTLASNERIALTKEMRLLFEISNLRTATPATVSRAGILYINPQDLGWSPFILSWINTRTNKQEHPILLILFDKYIPTLLEVFKSRLKRITPISEIAMLQMTCFLLDCCLTPQNTPNDCPKDWYEIYFVFAVVWGFGSTLFQDQIIDWRNEFHKWWLNEFKTVRFPTNGTIFSFYVDNATKKWLPWTTLVPEFELNPDIPLQSNLVNTSETTRLRYFMDILIEDNHPVMLVGPAGSGKTIIMNAKLNSLPDRFAITNVPFNFYTTSEMLQRVLEKPLEKKAGRNFGPPSGKRMIYFVDDMNMPEVDKYGTVQPHTIIRQFMDYGHWYDRAKMTLKDIHNCQFVSAMNPTAGSFTIDPRLQRHFCTFAANEPSADALYHILNSILSQHLENPVHKFRNDVIKLCDSLVQTAIILHQRVSTSFLPTAIKFHYNFNLRDISNIFTGMLYSNSEICPNPEMLIRLWVHESSRVYGDKLVDIQDIRDFQKVLIQSLRKGVEAFNEDMVMSQPLIYCHFAKGLADMKYGGIREWALLSKLLTEAQSEYNDLVGAMNLVLFEDAMSHVCRISRIIESSRGYALLIGVGGSGKQSLSRLAAYISSLDVFQIQLTKDYSINDLRINIASLYLKAGVKGTPCCFLLTDSEVPKEQFLVLVNDLLASGEIPELFADDEIENIIGNMRNEAKQEGIPEIRELIWKFYIEKVRAMLKVILCFSPVGATLRVRSRKFPALVNCTTIDWFHEWPQEALESVSYRFLSEIEVLEASLSEPISKFMAFVHTSVNQISQVYLANDKRYNYTTPKSFLELISLYTKLLEEKIKANKNQSFRLSNGLIKLAKCSVEADSLQDVLKDQEVILKVKNQAADELIKVVSFENEKVSKERAFATEEERKVRTIEEDVTVEAANCEEDYHKAEPALIAAQEALNTLNKNNLTELKSFGSPPEAVVNVCSAVLVLFAPKGKVPKDRSWKAARVLMGNVDQFLKDLIYYDKEHIHADVIKALQPYLKDPEFDPEKIMQKSGAAAGLCSWVLNIYRFYEVWLVVEPKLKALTTAQNTLQAARDKLGALQSQLNRLEEELAVIQMKLDSALAEKQKCQDMADKTAFTIDLANRLINGLASNKKRWQDSVASLGGSLITLPGDVLLLSCFISYVGCFTRVYRTELQKGQWWPRFKTMEKPIPASGNDPFEMVCDDAQIAEWNNQGLPSDRMSAENAAILIHSQRYPLMIDPQLQGIKWVKSKYSKDLIVLRLTQRGYLDSVEKAISNGNVLLIENIGENVDAVLNPVLGRNLIKKGTCLKMGDREIDFNPKFRLILHTKLANPHYKPEMQAQTTLINFTVTRDGLEEQLLGEVVKAERPDLAALRSKLTQQQNNFKITLKFLEDDLLKRLAAAGDNVLEDVTLVMNLEKTKRTSDEVEIKVVEATATAIQIDAAREFYRPAAERASIIYFILNDLFKIKPIYQFSLKAYTVVFTSAIAKAEPSEVLRERVSNLIDSLTFNSFMYTARALFEADKLIFLTQMATQIFLNAGDIKQNELDFLLRFPYTPNLNSPCPFLTTVNWGGIKALSDIEPFRGLDKDVESSMKRWKTFVELEAPEKEKLPGEWKTKTAIQRLCIMRSLRPDRMTYALEGFIQETLGPQFIGIRMLDFPTTFEESSAETHVFFVLSPGVDPLKDVEKLGKVLGFTMDLQNLHNVSLGQGQEIIAENAIRQSSREGHWVILQNIHLVAKWLATLEKTMETTFGNAHPDYRLYLSAEPSADPAYHILPQGILESAIKITNEPPTGMLQNVHKALDNFTQETLEMCSKETEFKAILFSLCYFHAVIAERRKFGAQGWNRVYPFNVGDLTISVYVLYNYLEANNRVPWEDLRYLFGEIMYGGHITDDWDRRLCRTYLEEFMQPELIDGELFYCKGFQAPGILDYNGYHMYIDDNLPSESPHLYGLHLNAEIGFLTTVAERLFRIIFELQPRMAGGSAEGELSQEDMVKLIIEDILDKISAPFNIPELISKAPDFNPFIIVAFQECDRMNLLMGEISRSLRELELGLKGELTISSLMENLMQSLFMDQVPESWTKLAYPSTLGIQSWFADLLLRLRELEGWIADFRLPSSVWLGGFFNPQSFLTAIMQQTARKNEWPLDRMCLNCDVTKKAREEISMAPREGAYVNGLYMEGARWDTKLGSIADAFMKDLYPLMPVIFIKAITQDKQDTKNVYECPVYKIRMRGPTYVWTFNLKTKEKASKWTLAGVCLLLQP